MWALRVEKDTGWPPVSSSQTGGMRREENTEQEAGDACVGVVGWVEGVRRRGGGKFVAVPEEGTFEWSLGGEQDLSRGGWEQGE